MIIACPACATRYAVPDSSIGVEGRVVRCAKCRHSWFQDGPDTAPLLPPVATPEPVPSNPPSIATPPPAEPSPAPPQPIAEQHEVAAPMASVPSPPAPSPVETPPRQDPADWDAPAHAASAEGPPYQSDTAMPWVHSPDDHGEADEGLAAESRFSHAPPFRPRRNPARLWTIAAIIFALVAIGAMAAVAKFGLPSWAPLTHSTFAAGPPDLVLDFPATRQDRRTLPNGTEYFGVSGRITNVGKQRRAVPTLLIVLRDAGNRSVYSWEVTPPKGVLAPGETMPVIEAVTDIPRTAKYAEIGWKRA